MNNKGRSTPYGNMNELEKQVLRINTLEVHVKKLLKFEEQFRTYKYEIDKLTKKQSKTEIKVTQPKNITVTEQKKEGMNVEWEMEKRDRKIDELTRRMNKLEQLVQGWKSAEREVLPDSHFPSEKEIQSFMFNIQKKVEELESNYLLLKEVQASLIKKVDVLLEKNDLSSEEKKDNIDLNAQHNPIFKTLYIDKFYLDKYEQNNNFSQLGIKELSGALNIGATYGKDVIPKEVTEHVKKEIEDMKKMKDEMLNHQPDSEQEGDIQSDEDFSEVVGSQSEEDTFFTEIEIEEDPWS